MRTWRRWVGAVVVCVPVLVGAQGGVAAEASSPTTCTPTVESTPQLVVATIGPAECPAFLSVAPGMDFFVGSAAGASQGLSVTARVSGQTLANGRVANFSEQARATWADVLHLTPTGDAEAASVRLAFRVISHAGSEVAGVEQPPTPVFLTAWSFASAAQGESAVMLALHDTGWNLGGTGGQADTRNLAFDDLVGMTYALNGATSLPLFWTLALQTSQSMPAESDTPIRFDFWANAFAVVTDVKIYNRDGEDVTTAYQYAFEHDARVDPSLAPEPASLVLLGTGLIGLVSTVRRHRA